MFGKEVTIVTTIGDNRHAYGRQLCCVPPFFVGPDRDGLMKAVGLAARAFAPAAELLKSAEQYHIACLIADIRMPGMSGLDVQARLNSQNCRIPTIFITGHGDANASSAYGAVEFLQNFSAMMCCSTR
jgi:hypothetical protein